MSQDLFNNLSNDYIYPDLAPCPGDSDENTFEFLPGNQIGIISGSSIIAAMGLNDIAINVDGWVQQTKYLQSGEITFITGLTKGISNQVQYFPWDGSVAYTGSNHGLYMSVNVSINYYKNFRYYQNAFFATSDSAEEITIEDAIDTKLSELGISIGSTYDTSGLTFTGSQSGYWFDVTAIDVSIWEPDVSVWGESLVEDISSAVPAFKYPNTAMLGYALKITYPTSSTIADSDKYVKINHVPDYLTYYEVSTGDPNSYVRYYRSVDVGMSGGSCAADDVMSAADYLDKVETNGLWEKVGPLRIWLTAPDPDDSAIENLITGFYVFNPQSFTVKLDYITIL